MTSGEFFYSSCFAATILLVPLFQKLYKRLELSLNELAIIAIIAYSVMYVIMISFDTGFEGFVWFSYAFFLALLWCFLSTYILYLYFRHVVGLIKMYEKYITRE